MIFLLYLFFFSLLSVLLDLTIFFSIISLFLGSIIYFDTSFSEQGIAICTFAILHLISRLCYHSRKIVMGKNIFISCNFFSLCITTVIFAIPIWYIIIWKLKITFLSITALYIIIPSIIIAWAILFKIVDRIFIHKREVQELVLGDYFTVHRSRRHLTHIYIFKFKDSPDLYTTGMWRYKIFIEKIGSTFSCTFGKGIFGTTYITKIKLIEDVGVNVPINTKRSLTKKDYSFPWYLLFLIMGILVFCFAIFILYVAYIGFQTSDISLLKYVELYKVIGISGIILGITLIIISILIFIRKK